MAITVSMASGMEGVGKRVVASNLGLLFARRCKAVILVDLDVGGAFNSIADLFLKRVKY